jgi:hypothetical protein
MAPPWCPFQRGLPIFSQFRRYLPLVQQERPLRPASPSCPMSRTSRREGSTSGRQALRASPTEPADNDISAWRIGDSGLETSPLVAARNAARRQQVRRVSG